MANCGIAAKLGILAVEQTSHVQLNLKNPKHHIALECALDLLLCVATRTRSDERSGNSCWVLAGYGYDAQTRRDYWAFYREPSKLRVDKYS